MNQSTHRKYLLSFNSPSLEALYKKAIQGPQNRILYITLIGYFIMGISFGGYTFLEDHDNFQLIYFVGVPIFSLLQMILLRLKPQYSSQMLMFVTLVISVTMVEIFKLYRDSKFTKLTSLFYGYALYFLNSVMLINKIPWFYNTLFFFLIYLYAGIRLFEREDYSFSIFGGPMIFIIFQTLLNYSQEELERKSFEDNERFKENLSSFKSLIKEVIPNQVFIFKMENKHLLFCNDSAENLLQRTQPEHLESVSKQNVMKAFMRLVHIKAHENDDMGFPSTSPLVKEQLPAQMSERRNRELPRTYLPEESMGELSSNRVMDIERSSRNEISQFKKESDDYIKRTSLFCQENSNKTPVSAGKRKNFSSDKTSDINIITPCFEKSSPTTIRKKERRLSDASMKSDSLNEFISLEDLLLNLGDIWQAQRSMHQEQSSSEPKFLTFQGVLERPVNSQEMHSSQRGNIRRYSIMSSDQQGVVPQDFSSRIRPEKDQNEEQGLINTENSSTRSLYFDIKVTILEWEGERAVLMILNDITTQHRIEELKAVDQYKDRMLATVSHDLRTPLNGLMGFIELAEERVGDKKTSKYLEFAKKSSKILLYFINDILDFSQLKSGKLRLNEEVQDVDQLLQEVVSLVKFQAKKKGIEFIYERDDPESLGKRFRVDGNRINQVLLNFLSNALKFTHQGYIKLSFIVCSSGYDPSLCKIKFSVKDTGIGIKEKDFPKLFKLFTRIEQDNAEINKTGIGLGLTISNSLARRLNYLSNIEDEKGIKVNSKYGVGSEFSFSMTAKRDESIDLYLEGNHMIPLQSNENRTLHALGEDRSSFKANHNNLSTLSVSKYFNSPAFRSPSLDTTSRSHETRVSSIILKNKDSKKSIEDLLILVVDDDAINLLVESNYLKRFRISFKTASNGKEALDIMERITKEGKKFDLILMDCNMPIMDGFKATELIKEKVRKGEIKDLPVVALTANVSPSDIQKCFSSGMTHYLSKPLKKEILRDKLEEILKINISMV